MAKRRSGRPAPPGKTVVFVRERGQIRPADAEERAARRKQAIPMSEQPLNTEETV